MKNSKTKICIGDLVCIKKRIQILIGIPDWGIVIDETTIIPSSLPNEELESIESWVIFFPALQETLTIPKNCIVKITLTEE